MGGNRKTLVASLRETLMAEGQGQKTHTFMEKEQLSRGKQKREERVPGGKPTDAVMQSHPHRMRSYGTSKACLISVTY